MGREHLVIRKLRNVGPHFLRLEKRTVGMEARERKLQQK